MNEPSGKDKNDNEHDDCGLRNKEGIETVPKWRALLDLLKEIEVGFLF